MNATLIAFMSIGLYGLGALYEAISQVKTSRDSNSFPLLCGLAAAALQLFILFNAFRSPEIDEFSTANSAVLISTLATLFVVGISFKRPTQSMLLVVYPFAIASIIALLLSAPKQEANPYNLGILVHVALSILSYTVLSLAAVQAILVVTRNKNLKHHNREKWLNKLPPLLTMEGILFDLLRIGTALLALAIVAGFIFVDNLFAQHLAHKTFFSIIALALYTTLLIGRSRYGWRGAMAASLTLWATGSLMLGFFGTKLVLEALI